MEQRQVTLGELVQRCSDLLDAKQAAEYLGCSAGTLAIWRSTNRYDLPYVKVGRVVRYRRADLDDWLSRRTQTHTSRAA